MPVFLLGFLLADSLLSLLLVNLAAEKCVLALIVFGITSPSSSQDSVPVFRGVLVFLLSAFSSSSPFCQLIFNSIFIFIKCIRFFKICGFFPGPFFEKVIFFVSCASMGDVWIVHIIHTIKHIKC